MLILMAGLPGTGKSTVAAELALRLNAVILSKDIVRHAIFPPALIEYSIQQDDFVIDMLLQSAAYLWNNMPKQIVILDGRTFSRASQRQHAIEFAEDRNQPWRIIECICPEDVAKSRLSRPDPSHPAGNRTPALHEEVKSRWEPITAPHMSVRTDVPVDYNKLSEWLTA